MTTMQELLEKSKKTDPYHIINNVAKENGYKMYVWDKVSNFVAYQKDTIRIGVNFNTLKLQSTINHPKGRKQLTRGKMTIDEIIEVFKNPRLHTGKGYYSKKDLIKYGGKEQKNESNTI